MECTGRLQGATDSRGRLEGTVLAAQKSQEVGASQLLCQSTTILPFLRCFVQDSNSRKTEQAVGSARAIQPLLPGPGCAGAPQLGIPRQNGRPQREEEFKLGWDGPAPSTSADSGLREDSRARLPDFRSSFYTNIWEKLRNSSGPLSLH